MSGPKSNKFGFVLEVLCICSNFLKPFFKKLLYSEDDFLLIITVLCCWTARTESKMQH